MTTFYLCVLFFVFSVATDLVKEENVVVLNQANFDEVITEHQYVLVEFYAPWCGHCKALAPEYAKAASQLAEEGSEILLAKVDATVEIALAEKHEVRSYPTIKFFRKGVTMDYHGGRQAEDILTWLKKKTGPPATTINSVDDLKIFESSKDVVVLGLFKDKESDSAKVYLEVAATTDDYPFGITSNDAVYNELGIEKDGVVLLKQFDEGRNDYEGELTQEKLRKFISANSLPLVVDFTQESAPKIFGGDVKLHNLLFVSMQDKESKNLIDKFRTVAKDFRHKVLFVTINSDVEGHERIMDFFGLTSADAPGMRLIKLEDDMVRYKPEVTELSEDSIRSFVEGVLDGRIKRHLLSQDLPDDWDKKPVKVLVSKNFEEIAFDKSKNVLVEFYAPWCGHCKQLAPIYDSLGEKYKDSLDVVIAKMDATANELEHTSISSYPTIKLYKKDTNEAVEYNGERTLEGISKFIETNGEYGKAAPQEELEEEPESVEKADIHKDEL